MKPVNVKSVDEEIILSWINETPNLNELNDDLSSEFSGKTLRDPNKLIEMLDKKYSSTPEYKTRIINYINRPTALKAAIIERDGTMCRICGVNGFVKKGGDRYCEVHHMIELNKLAPKTLQSWNILVVCPGCHKKLHYADVKTKFLDPGWSITIDKTEYTVI